MNISDVVNSVNEFFGEVMKQKCRILSILPKANAWEVICEVSIDPNYTGIRGLDDAVELYKVHINETMEVVGFTLEETKRKALLDKE